MAKSRRAAHGAGTIRKKTVTRSGQEYVYWEARLTTGYDAGTGRQKQRSVTGKTQKEVREKLQAGCAWESSDLVFTDALGRHLTKPTVYRHYKKLVAAIGRPDACYHDLRHSYAVAAISSGIDIKTVQGNLGHATAAFTLDVYGHVTDRMKRESADKMEDFIRRVSQD